MLKPIGAAALAATLLAGCSYFPTPPHPVRLNDSPTDVAACRSLAAGAGSAAARVFAGLDPAGGAARPLFFSLPRPLPHGPPDR